MRQLFILTAFSLALSGSAHAADERVSQQPAAPSTKSHISQGWLIQETSTFRIFCRANLAEAGRLPQACEALRRHLQETWFGSAAEDWSPRCDIVVHPTIEVYVRDGGGNRQSSGFATLKIDGGKVLKRRVDLRADADDWLISALPHELTHVVLAERFARRQIPRWADEGMAILTEPAARQAIRRSAMQRAMLKAPRYSASELMSLADYPTAERRDAFYGQSASLVAYLLERDSSAKFLEFVELAQTQGAEAALAKVYQIRSLAQLDLRWKAQLLDRGQSAELIATRTARITAGQELD
ncbi:MAG TPA: hypothetical protein VKU82_03220 [Planctomycetaceae bacterium]|nr:hypothetical protein [Planctomycetaceae bacterium]